MIRSLALSSVVALAVAVLAPKIARAEPWGVGGDVTGHYLGHQGGGGAGVVLDLGTMFGAVRVGGFTGLAALLGQDELTRVFLPVGPAAALVLEGGRLTASLRLRAGVWAGATDAGVAAGGIFGAGAHFGYAIGRGAGVTAGVDGWLMVGQGTRWIIAPGVGLEWAPAPDDEPDEEGP